MPSDTHAVLVRPLATGRWEILEYATSAKSALVKASRQRDGMSHGDLILALDIVEISAIPEHGKCLYFATKAGVVTQAPFAPDESTWFLEWEGPETDAHAMLCLCDHIDHKLLVATACAIARFALPYVPAGENRPRIAIEMTEAWARGDVTFEQVYKAREAARAAASVRYSTTYATSAAHAAANTATSDNARDVSYNMANSTLFTARAMSGDYKDNLRQLSHIVREHIPLHVVLESRL